MFSGTLEVIPLDQQELLLTAIAIWFDVDTNYCAIPLAAILLDPILHFVAYSKDAMGLGAFGDTITNVVIGLTS
jgi:hypothetical protein